MSLESALSLIESVKDYKVLFVGDAITDEYHYVQTLGKAAKEPIIPLLFLDKESFVGGTRAAARHAKSFCGQVDVCESPNGPVKVRFVEQNSLRKLAEVHYEADSPANNTYITDGYDAFVVTDFGHGRVTQAMIERLTRMPFLAVAAQTNSSNIGFNLITKYPRADYIVIDEPEARLAAQDRYGPIEGVIEKLAAGRCDRFVVTHGKHGSYGYDNGKHYRLASRTDLVRDTMGAGDAFFSVTAPMSKTGSMEDLLLIGNAAGAVKCSIVGHRESVTKEKVIEYLKANGTH